MKRVIVLLNSIDYFNENMPIMARCVVYGLLLSHDVRRDTDLIFVFHKENAAAIFSGAKIKRIYPDESSLTGVMKKVSKSIRFRGKRNPHTGVTIVRSDNIRKLLRKFKCDYNFYFSHRQGSDIFTKIKEVKTVPTSLCALIFQEDTVLNECLAYFNPTPIRLFGDLTMDQKVALATYVMDLLTMGF